MGIVVKLLEHGADPNGMFLHFVGGEFDYPPPAMALLAESKVFSVPEISFLMRKLLSFGTLNCILVRCYSL